MLDLKLPNGAKKILLYSCCAPCVCDMMQRMVESNIDVTVYFYNPNIHPQEEYEKRKVENMRFAKKLNIPFVDDDYVSKDWFERTEGFAEEPERGKRCRICFDMRLERAALFARDNNFHVFTSSFGLSRWKDMNQVNECGMRAASRYPDLVYWTYNWRKQGGEQRRAEIIQSEQFYQQKYCGCVYSNNQRNMRG